jgi:Tol biopolymer transport system component
MLILALLIAFLASMWPGLSHAQEGWVPVDGTITIINNGPGDQVRPSISNGVVAYTSIVGGTSEVRYYDLQLGTEFVIPQDNSLDYLPDIDGSRIVFTRVTSDSYEIDLFDISTGGTSLILDPQPASLREKPSIGSQIVAWVDFGLSDDPYLSEIVVYDRATGVTTRLTNDLFYDTDPNVSPDGSLIVWTKCQVYNSGCHVWQANYTGSGWDVSPLEGSGEQTSPSTDGQYIVYSSFLNNTTTESNIFWQLRGGSEVFELVLPGNQRDPVVDRGIVVFENSEAEVQYRNWEALIYNIETGEVYQVANSVELSDLEVTPDGLVRVVWFENNDGTGGDVYASEFRLPEAGNQPPVIDSITAPLDPMGVNSTVSVSADFSDPDIADTHTALWDWGDGTVESGSINETNGIGTASGSHTYVEAGVYVITLTVTDNNGASDTAVFQYLVVYNPVGGFVTGSGWFNSPAGAYTLNPELTGRAHFGFVSRYRKGASIPSGNTEFRFKSGEMSFRSISYDWLVIAGAKAQFKGTGSINGIGGYGFLVTVTDNQINGGGEFDRFRIKIWDLETDIVVYDNQIDAGETEDPSTEIGSGAIVIHQ